MKDGNSVSIGPLTIREHVRDAIKTGHWQLDVPPHLSPSGRRKRVSFRSKKAAETEAKRMLRELQLRGRLSAAHSASGVTFEEVARLWLEHQSDRAAIGKKRSTSLITNAYQLKPLLAFFGNADANLIVGDRVVQYQKERLAVGRRARTVNSETATLRQALGWARDRGLVQLLPVIESIPYHQPRLDLPSPHEIALLLSCLGRETTALIIRTVAETGLRKSELFSLRWRDVDHKRSVLKIQRSEEFTPKTSHSQRDVFVSAELIDAIRALPKTSELVFPGRGGAVRSSVAKALKSAVKKAGLTRDSEPMHITLHMLRKAHATWQAERGTIPSVLQARLGHAPGSRVTQQVYIHASEAAQKAATFQLPKS